MDVLSDLLQRARVRNAVVRQSVLRPPWSVYLADPEPLTAVAALGGTAAISLHDDDARGAAGAPRAHTLGAGDIALIKGGEYTIADDLATPCQVIVRGGRKQVIGGAAAAAVAEQLVAPRTYGDPQPGATTMLHAIYELHGSAGNRLLGLLPAVTVVRASPRTCPPLELLTDEAARDEPGQDAVLNRLLELVLVIALRSWGANAEPERPAWLRAIADPAIGEALALLHAEPGHSWTAAALATKVGMSRAAFFARFTGLVGEPPMAYVTGWRMTLAADALRDTDATVAAVAHDVGYDNAFAFSAAFKRAHGHTPTTWRCKERRFKHSGTGRSNQIC